MSSAHQKLGDRDLEERFSFAWNVYREVISLHKKQFLGWIAPLELGFFKGKTFLDAGCGIGRNSRWPLEAGAKSAHLFDCSQPIVDIARENLKEFVNCTVTCDSIYDIAFKERFDVVFSIGVIHHLRHPRVAVEKLVQALKPGGTLILWVYAREGNETYLRWFDPARRFMTARLPLALVRLLAKLLTVLLKLYVLLPHKQEYLVLLRERSFRHVEAMVFDQLIPGVSNYWTREQAQSLVQGLPVKILHLTHVNDVSWTLVAQKTAS